MIGAMDQQITFQQKVKLPDGAGGTTHSWRDLDCDPCVWAAVKSKAVGEGQREGRVTATFITIFEVWNRSDLDETMRIVWGGNAYNIRGFHRYGDRAQTLVIDAQAGVA